MESISFRCKSCSALLKVRADRAGHKGRCKHCGAAVRFPARSSTESEPEIELAEADSTAHDEQPPESPGDSYGFVSEPRPTSASRQRTTSRHNTRKLSAELRDAPGWRKVRIGLMVIGLALCQGLLCSFLGPLFFGPWGLLLLIIPTTGYVLCAFVPVKGAARNLALGNLGVIAAALILTMIAWRMAEREKAERQRVAKEEEEQRKELADWQKEFHLRKNRLAEVERAIKKAKTPSKQLLDLRKKRAAAVAEIRPGVEEREKKLKERRDKQLAEMQEILAGKRKGFWGWIGDNIQWFVLLQCIQIILLSFFLRAIAPALNKRIEARSRMEDFMEWMAFGAGTWLLRLIALGLGEKDLVSACPRVALAALLTVSLVLLSQLIPSSFWLGLYMIWPIQICATVSFVWQELVLIEACFIIGKHLKPPAEA
jgi:hypothetical protein